jgi:hypothetical protein
MRRQELLSWKIFDGVVQEQTAFQEQFAEATGESNRESGLSKRSRLFRDRGISLDTTILSSFGIEGALRDMKDQAMLLEKSIARVAVIGPGWISPIKDSVTSFIRCRRCNRSRFTIRSFD